MEIIDARGLACPLPVINAKKALKQVDQVEVIVDNFIATQNLEKLAEQLKINITVEEVSKQEYHVWLSKGDQEIVVATTPTNQVNMNDDYIVVIDTLIMGRGSDELGATLLKGFIYALTEQDKLPKRVIFYNSGVKLVVNNSEVLPDLESLKNDGVEIYACGACLDYYQLQPEVAIGQITNMYHIIEMMRSASSIIKP